MEIGIVAASAAFIVVVLLVIVYLSIRVVQQYEKMVVFRLGRTNESMVRDPGLRFLVPVIDRPVKVDVREQFIEVPSQTTITRDNAPINVDFLIYWRISDPLKSVVNVVNFPGALQGVATTTLRAVIGDILLDEVLSKREQINEVLRVKLDEVTERWGGKVTTVEIREITPPRDVQDAMNRQLSAERTRRAVITESVFAWPGIGRLTIQAISNRDYYLVQGCILAIGLTYVAVNFLTDLLYSVANPRIRQ